MEMYIDRIIFPITSLGPGNRIVIWTSGCSKHCVECANPELWYQHDYQQVNVDNLFQAIVNNLRNIDGITITGGDPCEQLNEILYLVEKLHKRIDDILIYTGYTYNELISLMTLNELECFQNNVSVLIDGRYDSQLNIKDSVLRGSLNQNIIYLNSSEILQKKYSDYLSQGRTIQNIVYNNKIISVGIHNKEGKL